MSKSTTRTIYILYILGQVCRGAIAYARGNSHHFDALFPPQISSARLQIDGAAHHLHLNAKLLRHTHNFSYNRNVKPLQV